MPSFATPTDNTSSMLLPPSKLARKGLAVALFAALLVPLPAAGQGTFDPWILWTEVSVHQVHLPTDQILFWAYSGNSAWLYDASLPLPFVEVPNGNSNVFCAGHAGLANGDVLVTGGVDFAAGVLTSNKAEIFSLATSPGSWVSVPPMTANRFYPTSTTLGNGDILTLGGTGTNSDFPEIYHPATNSWSQVNAQLALGIYPFTFLLPDGRIYVVGPSIFSVILDLAVPSWTLGPTSSNDGASAVMYQPGKIMKCGGFAVSTNVAEVIDMTAANPAWTPTQTTMHFARHDHSLTILPDGKVLAVGGHDAATPPNPPTPVLQAEIWDPVADTWTLTGSLGIPRQYHSTSMLLRDGRVLVAGADGYASAEFYNPPYLSGAAQRPKITSVPAQITYGQSFNLTWTAFSVISKITLLRLGAETHSFDQNQRYMELSFQIQGPIGTTQDGLLTGTFSVNAPTGGNVAPPGYYLIFLVDSQGVPSVGQYVRL